MPGANPPENEYAIRDYVYYTHIMYITLVSRALLIGRSVVHNPSVIY